MIQWLRNLFGLCDHKWTILEKRPVRVDDRLVATHYTLQCEKCGSIGERQVGVKL